MKPILLFDVMSTLVTEPWFDVVPRFFGLTLPELYDAKDPRTYLDFEHGRITEHEYVERVFLDRREVNLEGLKSALYDSYEWMPGVESLLIELKAQGYRMHALSNYSKWYDLIERKLGLSNYLAWDFVSCDTGVRKPAPEAYLGPARQLGVEPKDCLFVDDREKNVVAAENVGMPAILRTPDIADLHRSLLDHGVHVTEPSPKS